MVRLTAIFIAVCVLLIAASLGAVSYLFFGLSAAISGMIALAAMIVLALYNTVAARLRDRSHLGDQIADLSRGTADLARQVAEYGRRIATLEASRTAAPLKPKGPDPLEAEIGELGTLIKQLAETVAMHDVQLAGGSVAPLAAAIEAGEPAAKPAAAKAAGEPGGPFQHMSREETAAFIGAAIEANRVDLYLQPIVTLPQRKVRYYEALARLRTEGGELILPADFLPAAEIAGLMPKLDNLMLFRCVQVVRRLLVKNRDVGLFCNLSPATLSSAQVFPQLAQFLEANRAIAPSLMLELTQGAWRGMGPIETTNLSALAECGFRFAMDQVEDLRIEPRDLVERSIRFIKVKGSMLLSHDSTAASDIHAADLSDLLGRFGVSLIAEKIESEPMVVDLLDFDVRFGQGFLFSPPRPVRADVLQGVATESAAKENGGAVAAAPRAEAPADVRPAAPAPAAT